MFQISSFAIYLTKHVDVIDLIDHKQNKMFPNSNLEISMAPPVRLELTTS